MNIINGKKYRILNCRSQKAMDVYNSSTLCETDVVIMNKDVNALSQQWIAHQQYPFDRQIFSFENVNSTMYLDVCGGRPMGKLWQYSPNGSDAQKFELEESYDGFIFLCSRKYRERKVSVIGDIHDEGNNIYLADNNNDKAMWTFEAVD